LSHALPRYGTDCNDLEFTTFEAKQYCTHSSMLIKIIDFVRILAATIAVAIKIRSGAGAPF